MVVINFILFCMKMALGSISKEHVQENVNSSKGSIIDISLLNTLNRSGDKDKLSQAINQRAEEQVNDTLEKDALRSQILNMRAKGVSDEKATDDYFDLMLNNYDNAKKELTAILVSYGVEIQLDKEDLSNLSKAIDFKLSPEEGYNSIMNGKQATEYYQNSGQVVPKDSPYQSPVGGNDKKITVDGTPRVDSSGDIDYGGTGDVKKSTDIVSSNKQKPLSHKEYSVDDTVATYYQNIYVTKKEKNIDVQDRSERKILRNWIKGSRVQFMDIIDTSGDNKFTKPSGEEVALLTKYFKRPMKTLLFRNDLNIENIWNSMQQAVTTDKGALQGQGGEEQNEKYRREHLPSSFTVSKLSKSEEKDCIEALAKLSTLYVDRRQNRKYSGSYTDRLLGMVNNTNNADKAYSFVGTTADEFRSITMNNAHDGVVDGIFDRQRDDKDALKKLGGSGALVEDIRKGKITPSLLKEVFNNLTGRIPNTDMSLRTILKQYPDVQKVFDQIPEAIKKDYLPDIMMIIAEGSAFGASMVDISNIRTLVQTSIDTERWGELSDSYRIVNILADYDFNGYAGGPADHGTIAGVQILKNFAFATNELTLMGATQSEADDAVLKSVLSYAAYTASKNRDPYVTEVLQHYLNGDKPITDLALNNPGVLVYVQKLLKSSQSNDIAAIMHANTEDKKLGSLDDFRKQENMTISLEKLYEGMSPETIALIKQKAKDLKGQILTQVASLDPRQQGYFDYILDGNGLAGLEQHLAYTVSTTPGGVGIGFAKEVLQGVQVNLSVASSYNNLSPVPGVGITRSNKKGNLNINHNFTVLGPNSSVYFKIAKREGNLSKLSSTLESRAKTMNSIGLHGGVGVDHLSAGIGYQQELDYVGGIEVMRKDIKGTVKKFLPSLINDADFKQKLIDYEQANRSDDRNQDILNSLSSTLKNTITSKLIATYPADSQNQSQLLQVASDNLFDAIMQKQYKWSESISHNEDIADYVADQRTDTEYAHLKGKYKITGRGVGLHAFVSPRGIVGVSPVSIKVDRFASGSSFLTDGASFNRFDRSQYGGFKNRLLTMTPNQKCDYLNKQMQATRGLLDKTLINSNEGSPLAPAEIYNNKFIKIPASWYTSNMLNIKLSSLMKGRLSKDANNNLLIPIDTPLRFVANLESQKGTYILNVGSVETSSDDLHLLRFKEGDLASSRFVPEDDVSVATTTRVEGINTAQLQQKLGTEVTIMRQEGNEIIYKNSGSDQEQRASINGGTIAGRTLSPGSTADNALTLSKTVAGQSETQDISKEYIIYSPRLTQEEISSLDLKAIESFENSNQDKIKDFIADAVDKDYSSAFQKLQSLTVPSLKNICASASNDSHKQAEIVTYMLQVFAIEETTNKSITPKNMTPYELMMEMRGYKEGGPTPTYTRIEGSSGIESFLTPQMMLDAYKNVEDKPGTHHTEYNDLIGYTAFYRVGKGGHRGYAMTLPGRTRVLGNTLHTFSGESQATAKNRLLQHIESDSFAKDAIVKSLVAKLGSDFEGKITSANAITLLKGDKVRVADGCDLQIDADPVYYLLGECANESVGLKIKTVSCSVIDDHKVVTQSVAGNLIEEYQGNNTMVVNIQNGNGRQTLSSNNVFNLGIAASKTFNGSSSNGDNEYQGGYTDPDGEVNIPSGGPTNPDGEVNILPIIPTRL